MASNKQYQPPNDNILQLSKFKFTMPSWPFNEFNCQDATLPAISTSAALRETPLGQTWHHGDKLIYEPLKLVVIVDEDLRVWEESVNWLTSLTFPHKFEEYAKFQKYSDGILSVLKNSNLANIRIKFLACHMLSLSQLYFSTTKDAAQIPLLDITFRYDSILIERI